MLCYCFSLLLMILAQSCSHFQSSVISQRKEGRRPAKMEHSRKTMSPNIEQIAADVLATLTVQERENSAVYLDSAEVKSGSTVQVDHKPITVPSDSFMAFVDPHPASNWGHPCRYLFVNTQTHAIQSVDASFPPFLKARSKTLRLIWKGSKVPDWAVAVSQ